jgi:hypothetical protein
MGKWDFEEEPGILPQKEEKVIIKEPKDPKPKKVSTIPYGEIKLICSKYLGTKKRWQDPKCHHEPDYLLIQSVLQWIEKNE